MQLQNKRRGASPVVRVSGRLDAVTPPAFEAHCQQSHARGERALILDFGLLDISGFSLLACSAYSIPSTRPLLSLRSDRGTTPVVGKTPFARPFPRVRGPFRHRGRRGSELLLKIELVLEELLVNHVLHAYRSGEGDSEVACFRRAPGYFCLEVVDEATPFDPLGQASPDLTLAPSDRPIGGLGIHMTQTNSRLSASLLPQPEWDRSAGLLRDHRLHAVVSLDRPETDPAHLRDGLRLISGPGQ